MVYDIKQNMTGDEQLVRATLRGDTSAFGVIVERYWNMIVALALTKMGDPAEAEDVAQESFLKAYSHLHTLKQPSRFAGWLSKIAIQQCMNSVRKSVRCKTAFESLVIGFFFGVSCERLFGRQCIYNSDKVF